MINYKVIFHFNDHTHLSLTLTNDQLAHVGVITYKGKYFNFQRLESPSTIHFGESECLNLLPDAFEK